MACVTEVYGHAAPRSSRISVPFSLRGFLRVTAFAATGLVAGGWMLTTLGTLETVIPAFAPVAPVMRRIPAAMPQALALVDQTRTPSRKMRESFIKAYTADAAYSNLDWRRNKVTDDQPIIADIGPNSVIEPKSVDVASLIEPRADRVKLPEPVAVASAATVTDKMGGAGEPSTAPVAALGYASAPQTPAALVALAQIQPQSQSGILPLSQAEEADAEGADTPNLPVGNAIPLPQSAPDQKTDMAADDDTDRDMFVPDDVPLPGAKPPLRASRMHPKTQLAYAPESGQTDTPEPGLFSPLINQAARSRVAIYDISAATVYLPSGEKLEAHSGIGRMRDNPTYVNQKNRGPTPPHSYNLRMREALFHGVEAIRLTPADGNNRYNRDGLLAHTFMLGRNGDSNGCVVFRDYPRFLRAFKRGEFNKLVVVPRMSSSKPARIASLF
ncbi:tlde1 domain-containing protein [Ochrobactrum sp. Q0168]|uniref:tlde1 domain-containing protein n=1 Tax=Ochrobactrum sp. Q0168 TaxID=2793241 RepID=UPI001FFFC22D